eukprot:gene24785-10427_t
MWRAVSTGLVEGALRRSFSEIQAACISTSALTSEAAAAVDGLRQKLASGPNFDEFIMGGDLKDKYSVEAHGWKEKKRKPDWMKRKVLPGGEKYLAIKTKLRELKLSTVCEEAKCPNIGECWGGGDGHTATATIMLMGDTCTRGCRFCAVKTSRAPPPLDADEPENVSKAIAAWGLDYVVLTSVDRDDISDGEQGDSSPQLDIVCDELECEGRGRLLVEALVPDFSGNQEAIELVAKSGLDVFAHNIETVERLTPEVRDRRANYKQTLEVLATAKRLGVRVTKSSIMLGCGETQEEVIDTMKALRAVGVDVVTLGQYMRPTKKHMAVTDFVTPEAFDAYAKIAESLGFMYVASGPMVRSSYRAGELFLKNALKNKEAQAPSA